MNIDKLFQWSKMPPEQQVKIILAVVVMALCSVIIHYENKVKRNENEFHDIINRINTRHINRESVLEARLEVSNQNYLLYLQKSEREYKDLLFEAKKLKEKIVNENIK